MHTHSCVARGHFSAQSRHQVVLTVLATLGEGSERTTFDSKEIAASESLMLLLSACGLPFWKRPDELIVFLYATAVKFLDVNH